ncbi:STAS/SEC14 domain-containing protein [Thiococcus pfennigii]|uniref:STAS/SEC14 domain-containing protein n=1 Tax=Thiococcus pfennigii TaxID=1057 RepID=UPI00190642B4|nr:STAS/SEC14 domain-containing protein [Thiococcus pfennigii]MBK1699396.1 hypothetical protein [Thiococcus pfennigii]
MLRHELLEQEGLLILRPSAPLAASDFAELAAEVDPHIAASGDLSGLLIEAASFPGWEDFAAFLSHFRFIRDHHRQIGKVAVVSDAAFLSVAPRIADHFVAAEVRHFAAAERDAAMRWLRQPRRGQAQE